MANNENVKIIVQEHDDTRPKGSGSSSDIVYVPGLCNDFVSAKYRNTPVLCTTVDEFESYFTKQPYRFNNNETYAGEVKVNQGDYDRGYIYAKELLNAGLTVLYEAICPSTNALENIAEFVSEDFTKEQNTKNVFDIPVSEDEVTGDIQFRLSGFSAYGKKSLIVKSGIDSTVAIENITAAPADLVTIKGTDDESRLIEWSNLTQEQLDSVLITVKVKATAASLTSTSVHFSLNLVEGDVATEVSVTSSALEHFYGKDGLTRSLDNLKDKSEYTVKYITSGGYPTFIENYNLAQKMLDVACDRGDAVALVDHPDNPHAPLSYTDPESVYYKANNYFNHNGEFGAMFTPWGMYTCTTVTEINPLYTKQAMPASFGYLMCLASAIKTSPNWLAMAGVTRGIVPNLQQLNTDRVLSNVVAENYQPKYGATNNKISINAITNVKPYGLTIWGNRTLKPVAPKGTTATNFLNTRNMVSDIKKVAYSTAKSLMFEQDSDTLWLNFKSGVSPLLEQLKSGAGISDYKIIRTNQKYTDGRALTRGEMAAVIKIFPVYAIEYFEITVVVSDNDVAIS